jgi:hypothetical protein
VAEVNTKNALAILESGEKCLNARLINYAWLAGCRLVSGIVAAVISAHRLLWLDELYRLITVRRPLIGGAFSNGGLFRSFISDHPQVVRRDWRSEHLRPSLARLVLRHAGFVVSLVAGKEPHQYRGRCAQRIYSRFEVHRPPTHR